MTALWNMSATIKYNKSIFYIVLCKFLVYNENTIFYRSFQKEVFMRMARPYVFPDPDDRSKNNPVVIANSEQVIGLYNQMNCDGDEMQKVTPKV